MLTDTELVIDTNTGDHDRFTHYVASEDVTNYILTGEPVEALCGKVWKPQHIAGSPFPMCPDCKDVFNSLPSGGSK